MTLNNARNPFARLISSSSNRPEYADGMLVDAHMACPYPMLQRVVGLAGKYLSESGFSRGDCLVFECHNSVPSAVALLAVLASGVTPLLAPSPGRGSNSGAALQSPAFCKAVVCVKNNDVATDLMAPESYLDIRANDACNRPAPVPAGTILFRTSGSLSSSKLVRFNAAAFLQNGMRILEVRDFDPTTRLALTPPLFHGFCLESLLPAIAAGASVDLLDRSNVLSYLDRERIFDPNVAYMTPSFLQMVVSRRRRPRPYRFILTGGEYVSNETLEKSELFHGPLLVQYGASEIGAASATKLTMSADQRRAMWTEALPDVEYRIVNLSKDGKGELQLRRPTAFDGYIDDSGEEIPTADVFEDGWYRTGDLAQVGPGCSFRLLGRHDLSVNRQGMLLPLAEIEDRLRAMPEVEDAVVVAGEMGPRGPVLTVFCVVAPDQDSTEQEIKRRFAADAPAHAVPERIVVVDALPRLPSGKLDRRRMDVMARELEV